MPDVTVSLYLHHIAPVLLDPLQVINHIVLTPHTHGLQVLQGQRSEVQHAFNGNLFVNPSITKHL